MKGRKTKTDFMSIHCRAVEKHPVETMYLDELYRNTDMVWSEYLSHLKGIAEGN